MYPNLSLFYSKPPIEVAKIVSRLGEGHYKFFSINSGKDARFDDLDQGTEPRPKSSVGMDRLEPEQKHGIEDLKRDIGDNIEQIRDTESRFQTQLAKMEYRFETQFAKMDARFDRLERSLDRWLFRILGLVS